MPFLPTHKEVPLLNSLSRFAFVSGTRSEDDSRLALRESRSASHGALLRRSRPGLCNCGAPDGR